MNLSKQARERLAKEIKNGAVLLHGNKTIYRNNDANYQFRQFSDFHYLTEWPEPDAHAVILINDSEPELHLFVLDKNEEMETWDGKRIGQQGAISEYGAHSAYSTSQYKKQLVNLLKGYQDIYCDYSSGLFQEYDQQALNLAIPYDQRGGDFSKANIHSIQPILSELRLIKHPGELDLHYSTNREVLEDGKLLLIDAAAEYGMYSSDITRTFPINGIFSSEQKAVYEEVLIAQNIGIEMVKTEHSMQDVHKSTIASISESPFSFLCTEQVIG